MNQEPYDIGISRGSTRCYIFAAAFGFPEATRGRAEANAVPGGRGVFSMALRLRSAGCVVARQTTLSASTLP